MAEINAAHAALRARPPTVARPAPATRPPTRATADPPSPAPAPRPVPSERRRTIGAGCAVAVGVFAVLALVTAVVASVVAGGGDDPVPAEWKVGSCIAARGAEADPVRCDGPNDGRIVAVDDAGDACPASAETWVQARGYVWCVDADR
jgi:hypothetical protein